MNQEEGTGAIEIPLDEPQGLEERVATLERQVAALVATPQKPERKKREWTPEQKAEVRARLLAGQEKAKKQREEEEATAKKAAAPKPARKRRSTKPKAAPKTEPDNEPEDAAE